MTAPKIVELLDDKPSKRVRDFHRDFNRKYKAMIERRRRKGKSVALLVDTAWNPNGKGAK